MLCVAKDDVAMYQEAWISSLESPLDVDERLTFTTAGETSSALVRWYAERLQDTLARQGHAYRSFNGTLAAESQADQAAPDPRVQVRLVLNLCDIDRPRSIHRRGQGTFVATIVEGPDDERE